MTSSKFNARPVPRRKPSICIAPAGSCLPAFDRRLPPNLYGVVGWKDLDPVGEMDAADMIRTLPRTGGGVYAGHVHIPPVTLGATITDLWPTPTVLVQISYQDPFWGYMTHDFDPVHMPIDEPFNTRMLRTTFIPGKDYRYAWFTY